MAPILPYVPAANDASTHAAAALAARARQFAESATASEAGRVKLRIVMEGPQSFWIRALVVLLYAYVRLAR